MQPQQPFPPPPQGQPGQYSQQSRLPPGKAGVARAGWLHDPATDLKKLLAHSIVGLIGRQLIWVITLSLIY